MARHPKLYPVMFSGPASPLFDSILNGRLELGLFFHTPPLPENLKLTVVRQIRFYLVVRKDLKKKTEILERFIGSREVDDLSNRKFPTLEKLRAIYPRARIAISSNSLSAHRDMVLEGLGVSVLPDFLVEEEIVKRRLADVLPQERLEFNLKLVQRETAVLSLNAKAFLSELTAAF